MFEFENNGDALSIVISSSTENVGKSIFTFGDYLKKYKLNEESVAKAKIVLRELLNNAIKHGNKCQAQHKTTVKINDLGNHYFKISVKDLGVGFDYKAIKYSIPANPKLIRRRGYLLINAYADQIDFNDKGNCITVFMTLKGLDKHT